MSLSPALVAQGAYGTAGTIRSRAVFITEAAALAIIGAGRAGASEIRAAGRGRGGEVRA